MKKYVSLFAIFLFLLSACEKDTEYEPEIPEEEPVNWEPVNNMQNIGVLNLHMDEDRLFALGQDFLFTVELDDPEEMEPDDYFLGVFSESRATEINDRFFVKIEASMIFVFNTDNPDQYAGFDIREYYPDFGSFFFPPAWMGDVIVSNDQNIFLTVYRPKVDGVVIAEPRLLLFRAEKDAAGKVSIHDIMESAIDTDYVFGNLTGIYSCGENFLISLNPYTYKVSPDGSWELVFDDRIFDFIKHGEKLLGFGDQDVFVSYDEGSSWEVFVSGFPGGLLAWQQKGLSLNNRLLVWDAYRITQIEITDAGLHCAAFCTEGLDPGPGRYIHRLIVGEEYVFAGTQQGLYYKPVDDFWASTL
ncbi:MAG: hypothetical protein RG741_08630 [Bacteroidales bacterium]|nr:hypothetical protein [Bacteroidales bacterium]